MFSGERVVSYVWLESKFIDNGEWEGIFCGVLLSGLISLVKSFEVKRKAVIKIKNRTNKPDLRWLYLAKKTLLKN